MNHPVPQNAVDAAIAAGAPSVDNVPDLSRLKGPTLAEKEKIFADVLNQLGLTPRCLCGAEIGSNGVESVAILEQMIDGQHGMSVNQTRFCSRECSVLVNQLPQLQRSATKLVIRSLPAAEWLKGGARISDASD